jgi:hypothetical protein
MVVLVMVLVTAVLASSAAAATPTSPWDPQRSNVPYVAWRGEQVRLVKCDPALSGADDADFTVENWTGPGQNPTVERPTLRFISADCVAADIVTLDPGLARVKLVATDESGTPILKHQFLVIWLTLGDPSIDEVGATDPTGTTQLGDPAGDGVFVAGGRDGRIQVEVKGTFPGPGGTTYTLPDDWATLADLLAEDSDSDPTNNVGFWDIHDDRTKKEDHRPDTPTFCQDKVPVPPPAVDAVDNCLGGGFGELGPFSRFFGDGIAVIGPFDPVRPQYSLLSDGKVDASDAPMPAARLDVSIAPNSGAPTDISGVGSLVKADKGAVYSRNGAGSDAAHNLYAPFYGAVIPATSFPGLASGVDGPARGNNFRGFLVDGYYDFWSIADVFRTAVPTATNCLRRVSPEPEPRLTPSGDQSVAVYTDEHGEAQVAYRPGTGAYYDNLGAVHNDNDGCDLEGIRLLGISRITAVARYPYQPVDDPAHSSGQLTKAITSLFTKFASYFPKGPGAANENARIVTVHAQDVDGTPFRNERVCFFVDDEADGAFGFTGETGRPGARLTVGGADAPPLPNGQPHFCRTTDNNGNAAIEVINSDPQQINVTALFVDEGLLRDIDVNFAVVGSSGGPNPPANGTSPVPPVGGSVSVPPVGTPSPATPPGVSKAAPAAGAPASGGSPTSSAKPRTTSKKKKKVRATLRIARISKAKSGKSYLVISVKSSKKYETVKIRLIGKNGRTLKRLSRRVRTNRTVKIRVSTKTRRAKVALKK